MIGLGSIVAFVAFASSAPALTATPTSLFGTAGGTTLRANTAAGSIDATCTGSTLSGRIANTAAGVSTAPTTIPLGSAIFSPCLLAGGGLTVTQTSAWTGTITALLLGAAIVGVQLRVVVPSGGVSFASGSGCRFTVSGSRTILTTNLTTLGLGTALIRSAGAAIPDLTLTIDRVTSSAACAAAGIGVGSTGTFLGTYSLNGSSGILIAL